MIERFALTFRLRSAHAVSSVTLRFIDCRVRLLDDFLHFAAFEVRPKRKPHAHRYRDVFSRASTGCRSIAWRRFSARPTALAGSHRFSESSTGTTAYGYDKVGNLQTVTYPNGVVHTYSYDTRNRLTNLGVPGNVSAPGQLAVAGTIASYGYTLDASEHNIGAEARWLCATIPSPTKNVLPLPSSMRLHRLQPIAA